MLCENCSKKEGTIHIVKVIEGNKIEKWLCHKCANTVSDSNAYSLEGNQRLEILNEILLIGMAEDKNILNNELKCINCNTKYGEFKQTGLLGCSECFTIFYNVISKIFSNVYGDIGHVGKVPKKENEIMVNNKRIMKLKDDLRLAISKEEYEKAVLIRDEIKSLEEKNKK